MNFKPPRYKDMDDAYAHEQWVEAGSPTQRIPDDEDSESEEEFRTRRERRKNEREHES